MKPQNGFTLAEILITLACRLGFLPQHNFSFLDALKELVQKPLYAVGLKAQPTLRGNLIIKNAPKCLSLVHFRSFY